MAATPAAELARARHFLGGWTLARYTARVNADAAAAAAATGPPTPGPRTARSQPPAQRAKGVMSVPSCATAGSDRYCPPRHPTHFGPSCMSELNGTL